MAIFTRQEIEEGLTRLGELAQLKGLKIELTLVGGAVMVLRFNAAHLLVMWMRSFYLHAKLE